MTTEAKDESIRILVVEDDEADQALIARALTESRDKFQTLTISNPDAARRAIISGDHDAFLIDWNLGGCAGIDIISDLSASAPGPMIAITRSDSVLIDRAALEAGAFDFLPKDEITPELLSRTIRYGVQAWRDGKRLQETFDQVPVGLFRSTPDGTITEANPVLIAMLGVSSLEELFTHKASEFYSNPAERVRLIGALVDNQFCGDTEIEMVSATGSTFWAELRLRASRDRDGYVEIYGSMTDITERRQRDQQLRLREAMLDQAQHMAFATDMDGTVIFWNQFAQKLVGWAAEEAIGAHIGDLGLAGVGPELDAMTPLRTWEGEIVVQRRDGSTFPAVVARSLVNDSDGIPAACVTVVVDLADFRDAEALAAREQIMADSVLNSIDSSAAVIDQHGEIVAVNLAWDSFARRAGVDPRQVGRGVNYLDVCDRSATTDAARIGAGVRSILSRARAYFSAEYSMETPEGTMWFQADVSPVDQPVGGAVIMHMDITALRSATKQAEDLAESRIRLLASVSHQLRTPLTAIVGFSHLWRTSDPGESFEYADIVTQQANDMAAIIDDLLVMSRAEIDQLVIVPESMRMTTEVERTLSTIAPDHGKSIVVETGETRAWGDPLRTRQIIRNLIANAIRHGGDNIRITASNGGATMTLGVHDDGDGIPADRLVRAFAPFQTAYPLSGTPGSLGIGLPVARTLAQVMGGDVVYDDHLATTFELHLPAHQPT